MRRPPRFAPFAHWARTSWACVHGAETIAARHMGVEVLGISCVTNMAAGIKQQLLTTEEVIETGKQVEQQFARLLPRIIAAIGGLGGVRE